MLLPRFSLLQLLSITTVSAVFCYVIAMATRGHQWAMAISIATSSVLCAFVVYAMLFAVAWMLTLLGSSFAAKKVAASPFATAAPPPQLITPPEDPE
ncbi:MAG: hypothetical protein KDB11_21910 [Planctomycetales bacterium]|nr:hypothetical protein [Planctomycetales bacterium]